MVSRMAGGGVVDVADWIDRRPLSRLQVVVFVLCFAMSALDGYDAQVIGFVAPAVIKAFGAQKHEMGSVFAAGLFGLLLGCLFIAPLADWVGRKRVLIGSALAFGVFSSLTIYATSIDSLLWLRFGTGLGLGGAMANGIALTAEYLPARRRAALTMAMFVGFPFGATVGGLLAAPLIPLYGWQIVFLIGGILPIIFAVVLAIALPESIRFLAIHANGSGRVRRILTRIDPAAHFDMDTQFVITEERPSGLTVKHLFREGRTVGTFLLWIVFFMSLLDIFFISSWLPTVLNDANVSVETAVVATAILQAGGVIGSLVIGPIVDRYGFKPVLPPLYLIAAVAIMILGQTGGSVGMIMVAAFMAGVGVIGGQTAANVLTAMFYPTALRATGVGWALGIGRIGSIVGPVIGGLLIQRHWDNESLFMAAAVPAAIACIATIILAFHDGRRIVARRLQVVPE